MTPTAKRAPPLGKRPHRCKAGRDRGTEEEGWTVEVSVEMIFKAIKKGPRNTATP